MDKNPILILCLVFLVYSSTGAAIFRVVLDVVEVSIDPEDPGPDDNVLFIAQYNFEVPEKHLWLYVNDEKVEECEASMCRFMGGPYPNGFKFFVEFLDANGDEKVSDEIVVELGEIPELPDEDEDGIIDSLDNCPKTPNEGQEDGDDDDVGDVCDNCPDVENPGQEESDKKKVCGPGATPSQTICQVKGDGYGDACDTCPTTYDTDQTDTDGDGVGDVCDTCPNTSSQSQVDSDGDGLGDACDNCLLVENPDQADTDTIRICPESLEGTDACPTEDGVGDVCDNCPDVYNPDQLDPDEDGVGGQCDNCPYYNPDQMDSDNDGQPDGCDCDDGMMGPSEFGVDCGAGCPKCEGCIPIVYSQDPECAVDIVFVPDEDYGLNVPAFLDDVKVLIEEGYYKTTEVAANKDKFNFYYVPEFGDYQSFCAKFEFPDRYYQDCDAIADVSAIVFSGEERACADGGKSFSADADPTRAKVVVHETGHIVFGLSDEYAGYGGGYWDGAPNVFTSLSQCNQNSVNPSDCYNFCPENKCWPEADDTESIQKCEDWWINEKDLPDRLYECSCEAFVEHFNLSPSECSAGNPNDDDECPPKFRDLWKNRFNISADKLTVTSTSWGKIDPQTAVEICVDGGDGWWKSDDGACRMASGAYGSYFDGDCKDQVDTILSEIPSCMPGKIAPDKKALLLKYLMTEGGVKFKGVEIIYSGTPSYFAKSGSYNVMTKASNGTPLSGVWVRDPRKFEGLDVDEFEPEVIIKDEAELTVYLPLEYGIETVEVENDKGEVVSSVDISDQIEEFCKGKDEIGCVPDDDAPAVKAPVEVAPEPSEDDLMPVILVLGGIVGILLLVFIIKIGFIK